MALITSETARAMADKGRLMRKQREEELRLSVEIALNNPVIDFAERTLSRVRLQMERLATEIDKEITGESKRLKELTDSYSRLADQERILAGRPLPGSRRPVSERVKPGKRYLETSELAPAPPPEAYEQPRQSDPNEPNG